MTKEKYLSVCEQLGTELNPDKIPPDINDLPLIAQTAVTIFNQLGDRVYPEIGYVGKDYTNLNLFISIYDIEDKEFLLEIISLLDSRAVKSSAEKMKREHERLKRKNKSG